MRARALLILILFCCASTPERSLAGGLIGDVWGVVTDPLKLRASSSTLAESLERTLQQLSALEGQVNGHVEQRLEQIRSIVKDALSGERELIERATDAMVQLEGKVNEDAIALIYRAECAAGHVDDEIQNAVARVADQITKRDPRLTIFGMTAAQLKSDPIVLQQPNEVYAALKVELLKGLDDAHVHEDTPAATIFWTYENLASQAKWTKCKYLDQEGAKAFTVEWNELQRLSRPWIEAINMKPFPISGQ